MNVYIFKKCPLKLQRSPFHITIHHITEAMIQNALNPHKQLNHNPQISLLFIILANASWATSNSDKDKAFNKFSNIHGKTAQQISYKRELPQPNKEELLKNKTKQKPQTIAYS